MILLILALALSLTAAETGTWYPKSGLRGERWIKLFCTHAFVYTIVYVAVYSIILVWNG